MDSSFNEQVELQLRSRLEQLLPELEKHFRQQIQKEAHQEISNFKREFQDEAQNRINELLEQLTKQKNQKLLEKQNELDLCRKQNQRLQKQLSQSKRDHQRTISDKQNLEQKYRQVNTYKDRLIEQRKTFQLEHSELTRYVESLQDKQMGGKKEKIMDQESWLQNEQSRDYINLKGEESRLPVVQEKEENPKQMTKQILLSMIKQKYF